jgi:sugar lactone lactonase YvrE
MNARNTLIAVSVLLSNPISMPAWADDGRHFPQAATFSTLITTQHNIKGLTGDSQGNLYTAGLGGPGGGMCLVARISIENPSLVVVGSIPDVCSPRGLAFDHAGKLYVTDAPGADVYGAPGRGKIYSFFPDAENPPVADLFASDVPGTDGVAFDRDGNLWTGDGTTSQGRVCKITPQGAVTEMFRVQPMANDVNPHPLSTTLGVGRAIVTSPPARAGIFFDFGGVMSFPNPVVANGLAFDRNGNLFVADSSRGAIWKVSFDHQGNLRSATGCDTTFPANTLCLDNLFVAHPFLEGADGIALDQGGNIWVSVGERNAVVVVTDKGRVFEVFRNAPHAITRMRNRGPLAFPTSPFLSDRRFCTANSSEARRDNFLSPGGGGKISCLDQRLSIPGMPLPVR